VNAAPKHVFSAGLDFVSTEHTHILKSFWFMFQTGRYD